MLEPLVVRVFAARRAALLSRLTGGGMAQDVAEEWLAAWGRHGRPSRASRATSAITGSGAATGSRLSGSGDAKTPVAPARLASLTRGIAVRTRSRG